MSISRAKWPSDEFTTVVKPELGRQRITYQQFADSIIAQDVAVALMGAERWRDAPNVVRITAMAIAEQAVRQARETGIL